MIELNINLILKIKIFVFSLSKSAFSKVFKKFHVTLNNINFLKFKNGTAIVSYFYKFKNLKNKTLNMCS